jgi:rhodanese-related sulfurtransferase
MTTTVHPRTHSGRTRAPDVREATANAADLADPIRARIVRMLRESSASNPTPAAGEHGGTMASPTPPVPLPEARQCCPTTTRKRIVEESVLLVDVRERADFDRLTLDVPEIVNVPFSEFEERFSELPRDRELVLVSADGERSLMATYYLMHHGYTRVANMSNGVAKWLFRGFPVKGDPATLTTASEGASGCCAT